MIAIFTDLGAISGCVHACMCVLYQETGWYVFLNNKHMHRKYMKKNMSVYLLILMMESC